VRVAILGAGAIGGCVAAGLVEAGHTVTLLTRGAHLVAIRSVGLRLVDAEGRDTLVPVAATDDPEELGPQDLIISTLKAPGLPQVLEALPPGFLRQTPLMTAMNGVFWWYGHDFSPGGASPETARLDPGGRLSRLVDPAHAIGAVIHSTNEVIEPGVVKNRSKRNRLIIGAPDDGGTQLATRLAGELTGDRVVFEPVADIRRHMWRKLLRNLSSAPLSVLTAATVRDLNADPYVAVLARALFLEGAAVAATHGFGGLADEVDAAFAPGAGAAQKPSMRQDLELGRPMELDSILRIVQDFARQAGVAVPVLDTVLPLVSLRARMAGCDPAFPVA
jgi:2-dehydropantoate 2-reductase